MKQYKVWAKVTTLCYLQVDAESKMEAWNIAEDADGGEFIPSATDGSFEIIEVVEEI